MRESEKRQRTHLTRSPASASSFFRLSSLVLCLVSFCHPLAPHASGQKKPKPALKESEARRAIANAPGFALRTGAVRVREISPAGSTPVIVRAEVTTAVRFRQEDAGGGMKHWRAVEFRTGDRTWEEFELLTGEFGTDAIERARAMLERMAAEFAERLRVGGEKSTEPLTEGPLTIKSYSALYSSAVAEIGVEAAFRLERDGRGRWRVVEINFGDASSGDLAKLVETLNMRKGARAREDLAELSAALRAFRRERGFYVVATSGDVLLDHLSPRYLKRLIRFDPWHRPYRYEGTGQRYTLSSDGPDGKAGTPDDVIEAVLSHQPSQRQTFGRQAEAAGKNG